MATIQKRIHKDGTTVYLIRVCLGRDSKNNLLPRPTTTFIPPAGMTEKKAEKAAQNFARDFERDILSGKISTESQKFKDYANYVFDLKEKTGVKHKTVFSYRQTAENHIYPAIGGLKLSDIRTNRLNALYLNMMKDGVRISQEMAVAKVDLKELLEKKGINKTELSEKSGVQHNTVAKFINGGAVKRDKAESIATALNSKFKDIAKTTRNTKPLSAKTIQRCHRVISTVLEQATKEQLIPFNPARNCTLPKANQTEVKYFKEDEINAILAATEQESNIKDKMFITLLLYTGCRKGELLGLKWDCVDYDNSQIHICNNLLYSPDIGIYEDTPKTATSNRYITLPSEVMQQLKDYNTWQLSERLRLGGYYVNQNFVFAQENGNPLHPDTVSSILDSFSKRHNLPHLNAHAFRHTMASMLYFNNVDSVSISKRLGHAQVSTTANIYSHLMQNADKKCSDILEQAFARKQA